MKVADIEVSYVNHCGDDLSVVDAARVSFNKKSSWQWYDKDGRGPVDSPSPCGEYFNIPRMSEQDARLISYLAKHKHTSPFNHSFITVRVKAPIFVARQLVKHKFMPWNEVSRRYVDSEPEFFLPTDWRTKAPEVKQGSSVLFHYNSEKYTKEAAFDLNECLNLYTDMIKNGVCAEQARMVLPLNTMTEWMWSGTLGAFCDMLRLRLDPHTQYESRVVAQKIKDIIEPLFPVSVKALLNE